MKNKSVVILIVLFLAVSVSGCNMVKGAGKDIENTGAGIQRI